MLTARLRVRCSSAEPVCIGTVRGRALRWHKRSDDGSGKCDVAVGGPNDVVQGVVFRIADGEHTALDRAEGHRRGYEHDDVEVETDAGPLRCLTYLATRTEEGLRPYDWYKQLVLAGALEHELPENYVTPIAAVRATPDPDPRRETRMEAEHLLAAFVQEHPEFRNRLTGVDDDQTVA